MTQTSPLFVVSLVTLLGVFVLLSLESLGITHLSPSRSVSKVVSIPEYVAPIGVGSFFSLFYGLGEV